MMATSSIPWEPVPLLVVALSACAVLVACLNAFARGALYQLAWMALRATPCLRHDGRDFPSFASPERAERDVVDREFVQRALAHKRKMLHGHDNEHAVRVREVKGKRMGHDMGNASTMFRVDVTYEGPSPCPTRLIVKLPKADLKNRVPFTVTRMNQMETLFYGTTLCDELKDKHGVELARGWGGRYDPRGGAAYAIMEDVTQRGAVFTTEQDMISTFEEAANVLRGVAAFHAPLFDATDRFDTDLNWIIHQQDAVLCMTPDFFKIGWKTFLKRLGHVVPEEIHQRGLLMQSVAQQLHDFMGLPPNTLVHGDCHLENAYFVPQPDGSRKLGLYDMQLMRRAKGAMDVASFMGGSMSPSLLGGGAFDEEGEMRLLAVYYEHLQDLRGGGPLLYTPRGGAATKVEYTLQDLKRDYKMALALMFVWNVAAALAVPFDTSATADYDAYATRLIQSVHRTSALNYALWYLGSPGVARGLGLRGGEPTFPEGVPPIQRYVPGVATNPSSVRLHRSQHSPALPTSLLDAIKRKLKYRFMLWATSSRGGHHGQKLTDVTPAVLEGHKPVDHAVGTPMENHVFDSYYVSGFSSTGPSVALRWCRRYRATSGEVWLAVRVPGKGIFVWVDHPTTQCTCTEQGPDTVVVTSPNGKARMTLTCVKPMVEWRVAFSGQLKRLGSTTTTTSCEFNLTVHNVMPHFSFGTDVSPTLTAEALASEPFSREFFDELKASHQEHYEVFTNLEGSITFKDAKELGTIPIKARGMRDRAFGVREWGYMQRYVSSYFCGTEDVLDGPCFNTTYACLPTLTRGRFGFVSPGNGVKGVPFARMSGDIATLAEDGVPAKDWEIAFLCDGVSYCVRAYVEEGDSVGLDMGPGGMWVNLRFATFEVRWVGPDLALHESRGMGASEFGYRFAGVTPYRPTKAGAGDFKPVSIVTGSHAHAHSE